MASGGNKTSTSPPPSGSPPPSKNSSPPPSSSPSPPGNDNSPPPPSSNNSDNNNNGSNNSPPPSGNNGSNNSPPPSGNNGSSNSPPTSGNNDNNNSPPPPSQSQNNSPPPPNDNNNNGNANNNNGNGNSNNGNSNDNNNDKSSPSPPSSKDNSSPSPPSTFAPSPPSRGSSDHSPAPPKQLTPSKSSSNDNGPSSDSGFDSKKITAVASVAAAAGLLILVLVAFVVVCTRKRKKKQHHMYYGDPAKGGGYYRGSNVYQDPAINLSQLHSGQHGYQPQPPPPPPMMSSGDMSSGFSGPHGPPLPPPHPTVSLGFNQSSFSYEELAAATSGFAQANLLGQGGFGYVFKGVLPNGKEVAVKTLKAGSGQGDREFRAEVEIISRVHHRHLVSLVGYCIAQGQKMLVYEFVPNDTLDHHLYAKSVSPLDWPTRLRIAVGSAKGLAYLHEDCHPRIIHRDIKASNILIDHTFEAKVADFGLAKLSDNNYTHVSTRVMGTFGYLAPEYAASGKLTEKSDVFSFGVMLLELITGRRPVDTTGEMEDSLVDWARPLCLRGMEDGNFDELVDPRLEGNFDPHEMARMVACAGASIRHSARRRPKMSQIVRALEGDVSLEDLNEGVKPGQSGLYGSRSASSDYDASSYSDDMKKFRKMALSSQDFSEDYGTTGELSASSNGSNLPKNASRKLNL